jgi:hypothetical protein
VLQASSQFFSKEQVAYHLHRQISLSLSSYFAPVQLVKMVTRLALSEASLEQVLENSSSVEPIFIALLFLF